MRVNYKAHSSCNLRLVWTLTGFRGILHALPRGVHFLHKVLFAAILPVLAALPARAVPITIVNGSFEADPVVTSFGVDTHPVGNSITGWEITAGSIDLISHYWQAADGGKSIDLHGLAAGTIRQQIFVPIDGNVTINFAMAGNPDNNNALAVPVLKSLEVSLIGAAVPFTFDATNSTHANMGWQSRSALFSGVPTGNYFLQFRSTTVEANDNYGPTLDNVTASVTVPEGGLTVVMLGISLTGLGVIRRFIR